MSFPFRDGLVSDGLRVGCRLPSRSSCSVSEVGSDAFLVSVFEVGADYGSGHENAALVGGWGDTRSVGGEGSDSHGLLGVVAPFVGSA